MIVHLIDSTFELFRHFLSPAGRARGQPAQSGHLEIEPVRVIRQTRLPGHGADLVTLPVN